MQSLNLYLEFFKELTQSSHIFQGHIYTNHFYANKQTIYLFTKQQSVKVFGIGDKVGIAASLLDSSYQGVEQFL